MSQFTICRKYLSCYLQEHHPDSINGATKRPSPTITLSVRHSDSQQSLRWQTHARLEDQAGWLAVSSALCHLLLRGPEVAPLEHALFVTQGNSCPRPSAHLYRRIPSAAEERTENNACPAPAVPSPPSAEAAEWPLADPDSKQKIFPFPL